MPRPLDAAVIREQHNSPDPVIALAVVLVAFHALARKQIRQLRSTDIVEAAWFSATGPSRWPLQSAPDSPPWFDHRNRT